MLDVTPAAKAVKAAKALPPHHAPLVPDAGDIQPGYALPERVCHVLGQPVRLFTFPEGSTDRSRTVVCLPGLGASGRSFAMMRPLARDLRLLLWTPPLHTPTGASPLDWNVCALNHADAGLPERFALVGSSFGSLVALTFALRHPERVSALVLVSPVASVRRVRRWALSLSTLVRVPKPFAFGMAPIVASIMGGVHLPPEGRAEIVREARRLTPVEMLRRLKDILSTDRVPELGDCKVPTLVVHGARDLLVPLPAAVDVAERIPNAQLTVMPNASHLPYMSHPEAFNDAVEGFLRQHVSRALPA